MKYCFFIFFSFLVTASCFAQDTLARRDHLSDSVIEHFHVLRSAPEVRIGAYTVFLHRKILLVRGQYTNGKKSGVWQFFDTEERLAQKYNYDEKRFTFEAPLYSSADFSFLFDDTLKRTDKLTRPLKIGGVYFGFIPYLNVFKVPFDTFDVYTNYFAAYVELLISPLGQLADYNVRLAAPSYDYDHIFKLDLSLFSKEDRTFIPATKNGKPVMSRIRIRCYVTGSGGLDFY